MRKRNGAHRNAPDEVLSVVRSVGAIALDPCSNPHSVVRANVEWCGPERDDICGLEQPWHPYVPSGHIAFWNPDWSDIFPWAAKAVVEWHSYGVESVGWTHHDHSARWCRYLLMFATAAVFWPRRVQHPCMGKAVNPDDAPKVANTMWYLGGDVTRFFESAPNDGVIYQPMYNRGSPCIHVLSDSALQALRKALSKA